MMEHSCSLRNRSWHHFLPLNSNVGVTKQGTASGRTSRECGFCLGEQGGAQPSGGSRLDVPSLFKGYRAHGCQLE